MEMVLSRPLLNLCFSGSGFLIPFSQPFVCFIFSACHFRKLFELINVAELVKFNSDGRRNFSSFSISAPCVVQTTIKSGFKSMIFQRTCRRRCLSLLLFSLCNKGFKYVLRRADNIDAELLKVAVVAVSHDDDPFRVLRNFNIAVFGFIRDGFFFSEEPFVSEELPHAAKAAMSSMAISAAPIFLYVWNI